MEILYTAVVQFEMHLMLELLTWFASTRDSHNYLYIKKGEIIVGYHIK